MADRDMSPDAREEWSLRNQTLRHSGTKTDWDDQALLDDPDDYSRVGGPEGEPAYGRTRSDAGHYPFNPFGGPYDRDTLANDHERGGYLKRQEPGHERTPAPVVPDSTTNVDRAP
jgi:hypothetical protein